MAGTAPERRLAAILSADVVGYSRLMATDEDATVRTVNAYREQVRMLVEQHRGRLVDFIGDNFLAEFRSTVDAVQSAVEVQRVIGARNDALPSDRRMHFRIGIHLGDIRVEGDRLYGDGINIAARLEALAQPGGICISEAVHTEVHARVPMQYELLGPQRLKNIDRPVLVYRVHPHVPGFNRAGPFPTSAPSGRPSLAVLPFTNMSGDPEQEYFADGMTEDLSTDLSKISALLVVGRTSTFAYKDKRVKVQDVARDLDVQYLVDGSVRKMANSVRITARLVDGATGAEIWSDRYDASIADLFALQDEVRTHIAAALRLSLTPAERRELARPPTANLEAYDFYLRGDAYLYAYSHAGVLSAREMYEWAIELDPQFALPYTNLGWTYCEEALSQWSNDPDGFARGVRFIEQAITLDDSSSYGQALLCLAYNILGRPDDSFVAGRRALTLNPDNAEAHAQLGLLLAVTGQVNEARRHFDLGRRLDPRNAGVLFNPGIAAFGEGDYSRAREQLRQAANSHPGWVSGRVWLCAAYAELRETNRARAEVGEILRISPNYTVAHAARLFGGLPPGAHVDRLLTAVRSAGLPYDKPPEASAA